MKLLFPIFASLMLQHQVDTEVFGWKTCFMGLGRCKDHCAEGEKEIQKCKKKKCCVEQKTVRLINNYLQNDLLSVLKEDNPTRLNTTKFSRAAVQTKYRSLSLSPQLMSPFASHHLNAISISASAGNSAGTKPVVSGKMTRRRATSTKNNTEKSRGSATDSPQPSPPP